MTPSETTPDEEVGVLETVKKAKLDAAKKTADTLLDPGTEEPPEVGRTAPVEHAKKKSIRMGRVWASPLDLVKAVRTISLSPQFALVWANQMFTGPRLPPLQEYPQVVRRRIIGRAIDILLKDDKAMTGLVTMLAEHGVQMSLARVHRFCLCKAIWMALMDEEKVVECAGDLTSGDS
ncbi:MAG: hypothetical protein ACE5FA_00260 [Dehalococcoidia bacterium]